MRTQCTTSRQGRDRTVTLHEQEVLLLQLRSLKKSPEGRKKLRERVSVQHSLAHISQRQGKQARY